MIRYATVPLFVLTAGCVSVAPIPETAPQPAATPVVPTTTPPAPKLMNQRTAVLAQSILVLAIFAVPSFAQDEEALKKNLTAVIALQGLPCGQVVAVEERAETDDAVSCADGNLSRVYLSAAGRVAVEKRK